MRKLFIAVVSSFVFTGVLCGQAVYSVENKSSPWQSVAFGSTETGSVTVTATLVPDTAGTDAGLALANGAANSFSALAAIVRFNLSGGIDARDGSIYRSVNLLSYSPLTQYRVRIQASILNHTYSAWVAAWSGPDVQVASDFSFRSEQLNVSQLTHIVAWADVGSAKIVNPLVSCRNCLSQTGWHNVQLGGQTTRFRLDWDATPSLAPIDSVMGFSKQPTASFNDLACSLRFGLDGNITVRNGSIYTADVLYSYQANTKYHFSLLADVVAHTCSVRVLGPSGPEVLLANNYQFRTEQAGSASLSNFGYTTDSISGALSVCNLHLTPSAIVFTERFDGSAQLVDTAQYLHGLFPLNGFSPVPGAWQADTGWLFQSNGWGYTGRPSDYGSPAFFRAYTHFNDIADAEFTWQYRSAAFGDGVYPTNGGDAVDLWLRYQTQYNLYALQFDRNDGRIYVKRKIPYNPGTSNHGNYYEIPLDATSPGYRPGKRYTAWNELGLAPLLHDSYTVYTFRATAISVANGVQFRLWRDGVLVFSAIDDGASGIRYPTSTTTATQQQDLASGLYNDSSVPGWQPEWGRPIRTAGSTGFRADNVQAWFDNFTVNGLP